MNYVSCNRPISISSSFVIYSIKKTLESSLFTVNYIQNCLMCTYTYRIYTFNVNIVWRRKLDWMNKIMKIEFDLSIRYT